MNKPRKTIPHFASEAEERAFWEGHDSTDCIDWTKARRGRAVADLRAYLRKVDAERLPGAPEITEAEVAQAIAEVRAERTKLAKRAQRAVGTDGEPGSNDEKSS